MDTFLNFAYGTLASGITNVATSASLTAGHGARFPAGNFNAVIWNATDYSSPTAAFLAGAAEIVRVTARSTDDLTITRAQENTSGTAHNAAGKTYAVAQVWTAASVENIVSRVIPGTAMGANAIDTSKLLNTKSVSADTAFTFSAAPTAGTRFALRLTETGGANRTITIPSSYSQNRGATITTFTLPANATLDLGWHYDGTTYFLFNDYVTPAQAKLPVEITIAASDEDTALTSTGNPKVTFRMPFAMTVTAVRGSLSTAQSSGSILTVDVNEGGNSILGTKLTIDNTEKTSTTAAAAATITDSALADDAEITIDIDQVGDGTAKGLKVTLIGTRA
jgi:hypothetical protein